MLDGDAEFKELYQVLSNLKDGTGDFTCSDSLPEQCFPGLYVENIGHISLPVQDEQAQKIKKVAKKTQELQDTTVIKSWQIDAKQVIINNDKFNEGVENLFSVVQKCLGLRYNDENIEIRFNKLLLYEKGLHFKVNTTEVNDDEEQKDVFGLIEIQLPSVFEGGKLTVIHAGKENVVEMDGEKSVYCCKYAAYYCDCEKEVSEVTSGYRLALVYSLCWTAPGDLPSADTEVTVARDVARILPEICNERNIFFSWLLSNTYTKSDFSGNGVNALLEVDAVVAKALVQANERLSEDEQYEFHIVEVTREVDEFLEYNNGIPSYRNGEEDITAGLTFHNFDGTERKINIFCSDFCFWDHVLNSQCPSDMSLSDFETEQWGKGYYDDEIPSTMNYPDFDRLNTYTRYAIFAWPKENFVEILGRDDYEASINWVFDKFIEVKMLNCLDPDFQKAEKYLKKLMAFAIEANTPEVASSIFNFLLSNLKSESVRLANVFITDVMAKERYCIRDMERHCLGNDDIISPLVELTVALGWSSISESLTNMFHLSPVSQHSRWAEFLLKLVEETKDNELLVPEDVFFKSILTCLVETVIADARANQLESADQKTRKNTRVEKIAILLLRIGDEELLENFTGAVCDYVGHSEDSCILKAWVESLMSQKLLSENRFCIQLLKCRIQQLEKFEKIEVKPFSWEQEEAVVDGHPTVQAFLRGPTKKMKYDVFTSHQEAEDFRFKYFKRPWPATDTKVDPCEFSVWVSIHGNGAKTFVIIRKTTEWHDRKVAKFNQSLDELKRLRICHKHEFK